MPKNLPTPILLTGAGGFVGRHVAAHWPVVALNGEGGRVDLRDREAVRARIAAVRPATVLHLAAQSHVPDSFRDPRFTFEVNFTGTLNLLEALQAEGFSGRFLFVGSGDMYGRVAEEVLPVSEAHPLHPRSPYAVSKVAAEALCYQWSQTAGFQVVLARAFNHIGPGQNPRFAIAGFARQLAEIARKEREPVLFTGDLDVTRDFLDVRDVVSAYGALLISGKSGEVYNVCSGREWHLSELLKLLIQISGLRVEVRQDPERMRPAEQRRACGDMAKLHRDTGWCPVIPMSESITKIWQELQRNMH